MLAELVDVQAGSHGGEILEHRCHVNGTRGEGTCVLTACALMPHCESVWRRA